MHRLHSQLLLSATDLVSFHECDHLSALDLAALDDKALKAQRSKPDDQADLLFRKGLRAGASIIYQATFLDGDLVGHADFLRKVNRPSALGNHS